MSIAASISCLAIVVWVLHGFLVRELAELHTRCDDLLLRLAKIEET